MNRPTTTRCFAFAVAAFPLLLTACVGVSENTRGAAASSPIKSAFGAASPDAPAQLVQFGQFAGRWSCGVSERRPDGSWKTRPDNINWTFFYTLNGMAVQDIRQSENPSGDQEGIATSLRLFNPRTQSWNTSWTNTVEASFELWSGGIINDEIVLSSVRERRPVKIRFFNILPRQFQWTYEAATNSAGTEFVPVRQLLCQRQD